jgi:GT2 family glycosyltransferase
MKLIAVLITCHNRKEKTLACLSSLYAATELVNTEYIFDIYLVDDGSTDGTGDAVRMEFPSVNVIEGDGSLYWNRGMRLAWETAAKAGEYDFYLWLNDDTELKKDAIIGLLNGNDHQIIIGTTISKVTKEITYGGFDITNSLIQPSPKFTQCEYFNGNIVLIPRKVFEKVGYNDHTFHHALGDFDYGLRARKSGFELMVAPGISGYCEKHEKAPKWRNKEFPFLIRLKYLYTPTGNNPIEFFRFELRHNGLLLAIKRFFTLHLRTIIPEYWDRYKK